MTMTSGSDPSLQLGLESATGNRRVRLEIEFPGCEAHDFPSCPTADGILRGKDNRRIGVRAFVFEGGRETWSQGIRLEGETTFRGVVQDDAKLDFFEPHNTEVGTLTLGGSSRGFSPLSIRMLVQRITRVEYPERTFTLGGSTVNATITSPDLSGAELTATERVIESGMRSQADQQFRDIIAKAITRFDATETHWNGANNCATIEFAPASGGRTLRVGDTGSFTGTVKAQPGGSPSPATWTLVGAGNAQITPAGASSNPATFGYSGIGRGRTGIFVTGVYKAVSKAGVAQKEWRQPTEGIPPINRIAGTFSGTQNSGGRCSTGTAGHLRPRLTRARLERVLHLAVGQLHGGRVRARRHRADRLPAVRHQDRHRRQRGPRHTRPGRLGRSAVRLLGRVARAAARLADHDGDAARLPAGAEDWEGQWSPPASRWRHGTRAGSGSPPTGSPSKTP